MPFPTNQEALEEAGYVLNRYKACPACGEQVDVYTTPGKREIFLNPMATPHSPAVRHYETCKPSPLPKTRIELMNAVYVFVGRVACAKCGRAIDTYTSPTGQSCQFEPMMEADWPVIIHRCDSRTKPS
jgi:hypothetical protein